MSDTTTDTATVDDTTTDTTTDAVDAPVEGEEALGDPGKKALDQMKADKKAAIAERDALRKEVERIRAEAELKDKPAEEQALEAARAEARAEANAKANERILRSELKAAASGKLADPTDAALFIDLSQFEVSGDGDVDSDALSDAIADLIQRKPHLAASSQPRFQGAGDGGAKAPAKQDADIDDAILAATNARNFPLVATLKQQKAAKKG